MLRDYELVDFHMTIKGAFGSFKILDDIEPEDMPALYQFAKVVTNYISMNNALKKEENEK
jgi:hypothetical protein